jgi:hypothetical protein
MNDRSRIESEDAGNDGRKVFRHLDRAGVSAIASVGVIKLIEIDRERLFHCRRGPGQGNRSAQHFIAALQHLEIVLFCKLPDLLSTWAGSAP